MRGAGLGWAWLTGVVSVLGGLQLLAIGVAGQYIARILEEVKGRPLYVLKQASGKVTW